MVKRVQWGLRWTELIKLWSKMVEVTVTMAVMFGGVVKRRGGGKEQEMAVPFGQDGQQCSRGRLRGKLRRYEC